MNSSSPNPSENCGGDCGIWGEGILESAGVEEQQLLPGRGHSRTQSWNGHTCYEILGGVSLPRSTAPPTPMKERRGSVAASTFSRVLSRNVEVDSVEELSKIFHAKRSLSFGNQNNSTTMPSMDERIYSPVSSPVFTRRLTTLPSNSMKSPGYGASQTQGLLLCPGSQHATPTYSPSIVNRSTEKCLTPQAPRRMPPSTGQRIRTNSEGTSRKKNTECGYCKNNGEPPNVWMAHAVAFKDGRTQCPRLRALPPCRHCGGFGDTGHTERKCPVKPPVLIKSPRCIKKKLSSVSEFGKEC